MRLIDADAMMEYLEDHHCDDWLLNQYNADWIASWVESQPTIEAEPVKHGRWECEFETYGKLRCSVCKREALLETTNDALYATSNYCPNCGAKMDGGADHEN